MMKKIKYGKLVIILLMIMTTFGCQPDPLVYERPANLVGTIYYQLEALGDFEYYLKCIDRTAYKDPLSKGGSWTVFAPTDEAFEEFMVEEGYASVDDIPSSRILDLVQYSIFSGGFSTTTLTFDPVRASGSAGDAFRKISQYTDSIVEMKAEDYPYVQNVEPGRVYKVDDSSGQPKTVAYFLPYYMESNNVERADYDFMFPGETYLDSDEMKVYEANAVGANIVAENGFIHALDKVIEPRKNIYQNLTSEEYGGKYSMFKGLLDRFGNFNSQGFELNEATGEQEEIFRLQFETPLVANVLAYNPYDEAYPRLANNANRINKNGTGIAIPTNDALMEYLNGDSVLGEFYDSYDDMSKSVLSELLSSHFFANYFLLCPSREGKAYNIPLNLIDYSTSDAVDVKFCSNGLFVGVDKVYTNDNFSTVMGPLLLDPDYTIMLKAVQDLGMSDGLASKGSNYTIFGLANDQFIDIPDPNSATRRISIVDYTEDLSVIQIQVTGDPVEENNRLYPEDINSPLGTDVFYAESTIESIILNQIVDDKVLVSSDNYYQTRTKSFIKALADGTVVGGGDILANEAVNITDTRETANGTFYKMDKHFQRPLDFVYKSLVDNSDKFSKFIELLDVIEAFIDIPGYADDKILGLVSSSKNYTLLAPNNAAIQAAIDARIADANSVAGIPDPSNLPTEEVALATAKLELLNFANLHILQDAIVTDGVTSINDSKSLYFSRRVDFAPVYNEFEVGNFLDELVIKHPDTAESVSTGGLTNLFTKGIVIHELDGYLKY